MVKLNEKEVANWLKALISEPKEKMCIAWFNKTEYEDYLLCAGWRDGFDPEDDLIIHSTMYPEYGFCVKIAINDLNGVSDDYEEMNMPYLESGDVDDNEIPLSPETDVDRLARYIVRTYEETCEAYKDVDWSKR